MRDFLGQTVILRGSVATSDPLAVAMDGALAGCTVAGRAAPGATLVPGAGAHVAIRPEDIVVALDENPRPDGNTLSGIIDALLFVGDRYEARVVVGGRERIPLFLPRAHDWREGQRLQLAFPPDAVSVWPA